MSDYFPKVENVETPLGTAEAVWATSATHIGVRGTFTVNRVPMRVRLDLHFRDGEWRRGDKDDWSAQWHALMVDRADDKPRSAREVSTAARSKVEAALVPWLVAYATGDGAELVARAGTLDCERKIEAAREEIAKKRAEIEAAEQALRDLVERDGKDE